MGDHSGGDVSCRTRASLAEGFGNLVVGVAVAGLGVYGFGVGRGVVGLVVVGFEVGMVLVVVGSVVVVGGVLGMNGSVVVVVVVVVVGVLNTVVLYLVELYLDGNVSAPAGGVTGFSSAHIL